MTYPDIEGYSLVDAINILDECNIEISNIKITAPPRQFGSITYDGSFRVLRVFANNRKKVELLICNPMTNYLERK